MILIKNVISTFVIVGIVMLVFANETKADALSSVKGKLSHIKLLEVLKIKEDELKENFSGAPGGMSFVFYIEKLPLSVGIGHPCLSVPKDFLIEDESYRKRTNATYGRDSIDSSVIDDIPDFLRNYPQFKSEIPSENLAACSLVIKIAGHEIPDTVKGEITIEFGWDEKYEFLSFPFSLSPKNP